MTEIQWTDKVWNCVRGCTRVSTECENCYAERLAIRMSGEGKPYHGLVRVGPQGVRWTGEVAFDSVKLAEPLRWRKPLRIFVNSMSDLFHPKLSNEEIGAVFGVMAMCPQHRFQVLTKQAERMHEWFLWAGRQNQYAGAPSTPAEVMQCVAIDRHKIELPKAAPFGEVKWPLKNVDLGVSAGAQGFLDTRVPLLLRTPAATRFVSIEPMLGPMNVSPFVKMGALCECSPTSPSNERCTKSGWVRCNHGLRRLDWLILGGESGPGARPMNVEWIRELLKACKQNPKSFWPHKPPAVFVKQLGKNVVWNGVSKPGGYWPEGTVTEDLAVSTGKSGWGVRLRDSHGGDMSEWPEDLRVREFPE
jgi:protein gp37